MTPVDYVSRGIVTLSRRKASPGQAFHLFNTSTTSVSDLVRWLNAFGFEVRQTDYDTWLSALEGATRDAADNALSPLAPLFPGRAPAAPTEPTATPRVEFDNRNALAGLAGTGLHCPPGDMQLMHTYLSFMVQSGFLPAPEVGSTV